MERPPLSSFAGTTTRPSIDSFAKPVASSVMPQPKQDGFFNSLAKDIVQPFARLGVNVREAGKNVANLGKLGYGFATGQKIENVQKGLYKQDNTANVPWLGETKGVGKEGTLGNKLKDSFGTGLEVASTVVPVGGGTLNVARATLGGKVLQGMGTGAKAGLAGGGLYGAGREMQQQDSTLGSIAGQSAIGSVMGGLGGVVLGGAFPLASKGLQIGYKSVVTPASEKIATKRTNALTTVVGQRGPLYKTVEQAKARGLDDPIRYIAETDLLVGAVDKNGTINSKQALDNFREVIAPIEGTVRNALEAENKTVNLNQLLSKMRDTINASKIEGSVKLKAFREASNELQGLALSADAQGNIPLTLVHDAKVTRGGTINYLDPEKAKTGKIVVNALKEFIENNTEALDVKQFNSELSKLYSIRDILRQLNNRKVEGGRLGKYFASAIGSYVGGQTGGPIGAIAGAEIGSKLRGAQLSRSLGGKTGKQFELPQKLVDSIPQSKSLGSRQMTQATTIAPTTNPIPTSKAQQQGASTNLSTRGNQGVSSSKNTILDRANKSKNEGGFVVLPFSKNKVKAIDAQTKKDIMEAIEYVKGGEYNRGKQVSFDALARKYEIPVDSLDQKKVIAYMNKLLDKTKTPEVLPFTRN